MLPAKQIPNMYFYGSTAVFLIPVSLANGDTTYNYQLGLDPAWASASYDNDAHTLQNRYLFVNAGVRDR